MGPGISEKLAPGLLWKVEDEFLPMAFPFTANISGRGFAGGKISSGNGRHEP